MGKNITKNYKRKVTVLKYKERSDGLISSKTITTREELTVRVHYETKNKKFNKKEYKRKHPILTSLVRERKIPICFRANCRYRNIYANRSHKGHYDCKNYARKDNTRKPPKRRSPSPIYISDEDSTDNVIEYENISSGSLSSCDDDIDNLLTSTRKRMRDSDKEWTLLPKESINDLSKSLDMNQSMCSLDTLILEAESEECRVNNIKNEAYSPMLSPDRLYNESIETNHKDIKLECTLENKNYEIRDYILKNAQNLKLEKDICPPIKNNVTEMNNNKFKVIFNDTKSFLEENNNQYLNEKHIETVMTKLEKDDVEMECLSNTNIYSIKQEIYSDI